MLEPTLFQIAKGYLGATITYWWILVPGLLMPLPDIYKHFLHPKGKDLPIPRWVRLTAGAGCLFLAQFLAYRDAATNVARTGEEKRQLSVQTSEQSSRIASDEKEIGALRAEVAQTATAREPKNSLRKRVMRLADDLDALFIEQNAALPKSQEIQTMTPAQKEAANHAFAEATEKTTTIYLATYRSRTVGIIAELKAKGLLTDYWDGPMEKGAEFRPVQGGEIHRLRELAYHLDGQDRIVRFYP